MADHTDLAALLAKLPSEYWPADDGHQWCDEDSGGVHRFVVGHWAEDLAASLHAAGVRVARSEDAAPLIAALALDPAYEALLRENDDLRARLEAFRDAYSLDAAWSEAEAALPEGWRLELVQLDRLDGAYRASAVDSLSVAPRGTGVSGRSPAAALRSLAAELRE